ncbi:MULTISPECIES: DNA mismatch repair protein MutS [Helcococcus]|uniref:DNA mismatch repair protein MutS n=1 Tax=Helcococcus bovis TaxID=3153252 RepID=A0ABW9F5Z4_9FIRM
MKNIDINKLTPMMQQYMNIKLKNMDKILFYRLGDFYEMFFDDAIIAAKELELVLTGRDCGLDEKAPMCGVPYHAANSYINRLVDKGYKIAIVEQVEDPSQAKGIVDRQIVKIISPGTLLDLEGKENYNNFIASIFFKDNSVGISYMDITTGEFNTTEILNKENIERYIIDFISKVNPREIILNEQIKFKSFNDFIENNNIYISYIEYKELNLRHIISYINSKVKNFSNKLFKNKIFTLISSYILLDYIYLYHDKELSHINNLNYINYTNFLMIDANTRDNLEIHKNLNDGTRKNSLLNIIDFASTPMGSRKINSWLEFPLINKNDINYRLDIVNYLVSNFQKSTELENILKDIYDLERILSKIAYQNANTKDLLILKRSLEKLPNLKHFLINSDFVEFTNLSQKFDDLVDIYDLINKSIKEDAPIQITEGGIIKDGYNEYLDSIKKNSIIGEKKLLEYEISERERTGINKLKVSYNKNIGYFIELTKSNIDKAPSNYIRRQTLKNAERYITNELNDISDMILEGQTDTINLEYKLFTEIRDYISNNSTRIKNVTELISVIDALNSFAQISVKNNYCRPIFNDENYIYIKDGRHPVIEQNLGFENFISNDTLIGKKNKTVQIITGPNMAGKSTYMRQTALILILAQIGCFVPASACDISISDAIFTRIGASDNLSKGDSTFMVEMKEMSNIIKNATKNSFVILDEVGRGTSTNDGFSIAKSILEYIVKNINCKTLFATHYHELTDLEDEYTSIENLKVKIHEENNNIVFLRKIVKGKTDKSYGIEVAKLSGLPDEILFRANVILKQLDNVSKETQLSFNIDNKEDNQKQIEREIFLSELSSIQIDNVTPIDSLKLLNDFIEKAKDLLND